MADIKFSMRNVSELVPYANNARTHSAEQITKIASSIKEFGFLNPVIISNDGGILAGHGRVLAAQKLGIKKVPCMEESHLNEAQRQAYILADNKIADSSSWDEKMLACEIKELMDSCEPIIHCTGFDDYEVALYSDYYDKHVKDESPAKSDVDCKYTCPSCGAKFN